MTADPWSGVLAASRRVSDVPAPARSRRPALTRCALLVAALAIAVGVGGCGEDEDADVSTTPTSSSAPPTTPAIVGEWQRTQSCDELVGLLRGAGMPQAVVPMLAEDGWIPGVTKPSQIEDPAHPCEHAVPRKHSHFFTADGHFGSRDESGEQVDDGSYQLVDSSRVVIGGVTFEYVIEDDTIMFTPMVPACAPDCFEAAWSVAVAYEGYRWERIR